MDLIYGAPPQTPAAMCRSSFRGQTSKNNKINPSAKTRPFSCHKFKHENSDIKPTPNITKSQKFPKNIDVLARSR